MTNKRRIGIVGVGHVGAHVANALLMQGLADELYLCDKAEKRLASEVQDLLDAMSLYPTNCSIVNCGVDYERLAECDIIVNAAGDITASLTNRDGELEVTVEIVRTYVERIAKAGFQGVWVTISNPCDVIAAEIWTLAGCDSRRVVGTGTGLDSARLRHAIANKCQVDQRSISADMYGEHGFSQFAAWSQVHIGGKSLASLAQDAPELFDFDLVETEKDARYGGYVTMSGKQCTEYAIAMIAAQLVRAISSDAHLVVPCSTLLTGELDERDVFASLPCMIGENGVEAVFAPDLNVAERKAFHASCDHIRDNIKQIPWLADAFQTALARA